MQKKFDRRRKRNKKTFKIRSCQVFSTATKNTVISVPKSISWSWSKWSVFNQFSIKYQCSEYSFLFSFPLYFISSFGTVFMASTCPVVPSVFKGLVKNAFSPGTQTWTSSKNKMTLSNILYQQQNRRVGYDNHIWPVGCTVLLDARVTLVQVFRASATLTTEQVIA